MQYMNRENDARKRLHVEVHKGIEDTKMITFKCGITLFMSIICTCTETVLDYNYKSIYV